MDNFKQTLNTIIESAKLSGLFHSFSVICCIASPIHWIFIPLSLQNWKITSNCFNMNRGTIKAVNLIMIKPMRWIWTFVFIWIDTLNPLHQVHYLRPPPPPQNVPDSLLPPQLWTTRLPLYLRLISIIFNSVMINAAFVSKQLHWPLYEVVIASQSLTGTHCNFHKKPVD